jgi:hypothetical protein
VCVCVCVLVCVCASVYAHARAPTCLTLTPRVCVLVLPRAQNMAADPMAFTVTSDQGAAVEGRVLVRYVGRTSDGYAPWALVGAPIDSILTATGDAWAEFVRVEGNGFVYVFIAPEGLDRAACAVWTTGNGTVACWMYIGAVWVNGAGMRGRTPDWQWCMGACQHP